MSWLPVAAAVGGTILGAASNASAASRQNRAIQAQNNFLNTEYAGYLPQSALLALGRDAYGYLGGTQGRDTLGTAFSLDSTARTRLEKEAADLESQIQNVRQTYRGGKGFKGVVGRGGSDVANDPAYANLTNRLAQVRAQLADDSQKINIDDYNALAESGTLPIDRMQREASDLVDRNQAASDRFEADAAQTRGIVENYGKGEKERIERESARDLAGAQRVTRSNLARGGVGLSSMAASAYNANAARFGEAKNNALSSLADRTAEIKANLNTSQSAQRLALGQANSGAAYNANQGVNNTRLSLLTGPEWTPWLNRSAPNMPNQSPGAVGAGTIADSLSTMGGLYGMANYGRGASGGSTAQQRVWASGEMPDSTVGGYNWDAQ